MKNIFKSLAIVAVAIFAGYNVYQSNNETEGMSDTMLANVEALANLEIGVGNPCYKGAYNSMLPDAVKCDNPCRIQRCGGSIDKCY